MSYQEQDFAEMLFAWPAVEGRIMHLYELDPTHVAAQPLSNASRSATPSVISRSSLPSCVLTDATPARVLLELDPTHLHAG